MPADAVDESRHVARSPLLNGDDRGAAARSARGRVRSGRARDCRMLSRRSDYRLALLAWCSAWPRCRCSPVNRRGWTAGGFGYAAWRRFARLVRPHPEMDLLRSSLSSDRVVPISAVMGRGTAAEALAAGPSEEDVGRP